MNLTYEEEKILKALGTGERQAVTRKYLVWKTKIGDRELRAIVAHLVTDHQICICTNSTDGYYFASCFSEFSHAHEELLSRIKKLSRRARGLRYGYNRDVQKAEQMSLI